MKGRLIAAAVVVGVLVAGAAVGDGIARDRTEQRLSTGLQTQITGLAAPPDVTIGGFPFLTQVLRGSLDDVRLAAPTLTVQGLTLEGVRVALSGVSTGEPTTARHAVMDADVSMSSITSALGAPVDLTIRDGSLVASTTVLTVQLEATLKPRANGRAIAVDLESLSIGGKAVDAASIPTAVRDQLSNLSIPVDALPQGMSLTSVRLTSSGAHLQAQGDDVTLTAPR